MNALLSGGVWLHTQLVALLAQQSLPADWNSWESGPELPSFDGESPIEQIFQWGQGVIVIIGVIGVLFAAGKMAVGKFGRSDLAADGVGGLVWTVMGISLMLIAIPIITNLPGIN